MNLESRYIIVTGGAGFIGSNVVDRLCRDGFSRVIVVDNPGCEGKWRNLASCTRGVELYPIGSTEALLDRLGSEVGALIHLGAVSSTTTTDADLLVAGNTMETLALARKCRQAGVPFIYASSASVYGDGSHGFAEAAAFESLPLNPYAWSKLNADRLIFGTGIDSDDAVVALRFFNVYGPREYHKGAQSSVVLPFYNSLIDRGRISLFKSGRDDIPHGMQSRDFVWVDDCVDVIMHFVRNGCRPGGIYNVGSGRSRTFLDMARAVAAAASRDCQIDFIEMPRELARHYQYHTCSEGDRLTARAGIDFRPTSLEDGVSQYVRNFLQTEKYQ